jgi:hypothetical protein
MGRIPSILKIAPPEYTIILSLPHPTTPPGQCPGGVVVRFIQYVFRGMLCLLLHPPWLQGKPKGDDESDAEGDHEIQ